MTVGLDDTSKAAGHKLYKGDNITIAGEESKWKTFTTGLSEIVSHEGNEHAKVYEQKLKCLAVSSETTVDELKDFVDFWMSDRAGDNATVFSHLGIDEERVLKCCAHIILEVDSAADKRFRIAEQKICVQKTTKHIS